MNSKSYKILSSIVLVSILVFSLISCSDQSSAEAATRNLTIKLEGANTRTIRPETLTTPGYYELTLTDSGNPERTYQANSETTTITINDVLIGRYSINVKAYKDSTKSVLLAEGMSTIDVTPSGDNTALVVLNALSSGENLTGTIAVTFDWSELLTSTNTLFMDALKNNQVAITLKNLENNETYRKENIDSSSTFYTFTVDNVPVSSGFSGQFEITYTKDAAEYLLARMEVESIQVFSGETSVKTYKLNQNNVIDYSKAPQITLTYGEAHPDSEILVTWPSVYGNGKDMFKTVTLTIKDEASYAQTETITYPNDNIASGLSSYTFSSLTAGTKYTVSATAITSDGAEANTASASFMPKVFVVSVSIDETNITSPISVGSTITLSGQIGPETTTIKDATWTVAESDVLELVGNADVALPAEATFKALKPGETTVTLTAKDQNINKEDVSTTTTKKIQVKLAQPSAPSASTLSSEKPYSIDVSWTLNDYVDSVLLYRKDNASSDFTLLETFSSPVTSYTDTKDLKTNSSYTYAIQVKSNVGEWATSEISTESNAINPSAPAISIQNATLSPNQEIVFAHADFSLEKGFYVTAEKGATLTLQNAESLSGATNFQWMINGVKQGDASNKLTDLTITYSTNGVNQNPQMVNYATLSCEKDGLKYSGSVAFRALSIVDTGVSLAINGKKEATFTDYDEAQSLTATVAPIDADLKTICFTSSNPEVASVDANGVVSFHPEKTGDVTITATPMFGTSDSITIHVLPGARTILNETIKYLQQQLKYVDSKVFNEDWDTTESKVQETLTMNSSEFLASNPGYISLNSTFNRVKQVTYFESNPMDLIWNFTVTNKIYKEFTVETMTNIKAIAKDGGAAGYLGNDPLYMLGQNNIGLLKATPSEKKYYATINFNAVTINDDSKRGGSFLVTIFDKETNSQITQDEIAYDESVNSLYIK